MNNKHGVYITRQQMNEIKRNQRPKKSIRRFINGANVLIVDRFDPQGEMIEATVLAYDETTDVYTVEQYNGFVELVKSKNVKGWWSK